MSRFEEAVQLIVKLFGDELVTLSRKYYTVTNLTMSPKPVQRPHSPILMGGASHCMLSLAAGHADDVSVNLLTTAEGGTDWSSATPQATSDRIAWVQQCAGDRFDKLELNVLVLAVLFTHHRQEAAEQFAKRWHIDLNKISLADLLESTYFLFGTQH